MRYAIISDSVVSNVVPPNSGAYNAADPAARIALGASEWCEPGALYRPGDVPRFVDPTPRKWTAYQFLGRFTESELDAVRQRAQTDATCWRFLTFATAAQEINSDDAVTLAGMQYLQAIGIIDDARRAQILGGN